MSLTVTGVIVAIIGGLLTLLGIQNKKVADAETKLVTADADKRDAVLTEKQSEVQSQIDAEKARTEAEKSKPLSQKETVDFLKKL